MDALYKNIKQKRKEASMTQTELALKIGYAEKSSISMIEKGLRDLQISKIKQLAKVFNCSVAELIGEKEE